MQYNASTKKPILTKQGILLNVLGWIIPGIVFFVVVVAMTISPRFDQYLDMLFENSVRIEVTVHSCELLRDGRLREHRILCDFSYEYNGKSYTSKSGAWSSDSPFVTLDSLDRALVQQSALVSRSAYIIPNYVRQKEPRSVSLVDDRWLAAPGLWAWIALVVIGLFGLGVPISTAYKRADLAHDPISGELVDINNKRRNRLRYRAILWGGAILVTMFGCLYGLSNRVYNAASLLGLSHLQDTPAKLIDCQHRHHGLSKGNDQIECGFQYQFKGQIFLGQAEAIDFRWFPTNARMDAEIERLSRSADVVARVDPQHPGYAIAFISNAWFVSYAGGLVELMSWVLLLIVLPTLLILVCRQLNPVMKDT